MLSSLAWTWKMLWSRFNRWFPRYRCSYERLNSPWASLSSIVGMAPMRGSCLETLLMVHRAGATEKNLPQASKSQPPVSSSLRLARCWMIQTTFYWTISSRHENILVGWSKGSNFRIIVHYLIQPTLGPIWRRLKKISFEEIQEPKRASANIFINASKKLPWDGPKINLGCAARPREWSINRCRAVRWLVKKIKLFVETGDELDGLVGSLRKGLHYNTVG